MSLFAVHAGLCLLNGGHTAQLQGDLQGCCDVWMDLQLSQRCTVRLSCSWTTIGLHLKHHTWSSTRYVGCFGAASLLECMSRCLGCIFM